MKPFPSLLFAQVQISPLNFISTIPISKMKFLKSQKWLSDFFLPLFFSSWFFISLKSPPMIHLSSQTCFLPFNSSHCLSYAYVHACTNSVQNLSISLYLSISTLTSIQKLLLLITVTCTFSLQTINIPPFLQTRSLTAYLISILFFYTLFP